MTTAEEAVRRYLISLTDPEVLADPDEVSQAEAKVAAAVDPIDKVRALSELRRAREGDPNQAREEFIAHARSWAEEEAIPFHAFQQLNVPQSVLKAARLIDTKSKRRGSTTDRGHSRAGLNNGIADVTRWMLRQRKPFTTSDVAARVGGSPATIKKAIEQLIDEQKLQNVSQDLNTQNRGRNPNLYSVVTPGDSPVEPAKKGAGSQSKPIVSSGKAAKGRTKPEATLEADIATT